MSRVNSKEEKIRQHEKPQRKARWGVQEGLPFPDISYYNFLQKIYVINKYIIYNINVYDF
jgi:hypothetical protein